MAEPKDPEARERALAGRNTGQPRRPSRGSASPELPVERALEIEPGVELHAGEDAGQVPRDDDT
jgi:hypothetical protein